MPALTLRELIVILNEELVKDNWGDIDIYWLKALLHPKTRIDNESLDDREEIKALEEVLQRVVKRINERLGF